MGNIIWDKFPEQQKKEYIDFLKIFGALSGLFKDNKEGSNARKPYLYYRNHEQLFARVFDVEDLTRKDSAFDAVTQWDNDRVGIGLKTWIHSNDFTFQKVAEFNKLAPKLITPLIEKEKHEEAIIKISELRNERIMLDKRLYGTDREIYHFITRDDDFMNIIETKYDFIDIESIELIKFDDKSYLFKDKFHTYKFYKSKSVLLEEFDASEGEIIRKIPIKQFDDPFELIKMIKLPKCVKEICEEIYLPLYQDKKDGMKVSNCSGINIRHAKSKIKGSNRLRPEYEIEVRISKWIHIVFPKFFGIDALNEDEVKDKTLNDFKLVLPDGRELDGRIKQECGKSLQTNPQGALGEWILKDILGLTNRSDVVTMEYLETLGVDSLKVTKVDNKRFKITVAEVGAYEKFKLDNRNKMLRLGLKGKSLPYFRDELVNELFS